jgi:tetratricopeptide (TPR) repeat protein
MARPVSRGTGPMLDGYTKKELKDQAAVFAKAVGYGKQGMLAEAARSYRFFLSKWPQPIAFYNYAVLLKQMKMVDAAAVNYAKAIALKPDFTQAHVNLGSIYIDQRQFENALVQFDAAIRHSPGLAEAYYNRGVVLQELRRHDDALEDYDRTLALQPNYYLAYLNKSVILYELKRKTEVARNYQQIRIAPETACRPFRQRLSKTVLGRPGKPARKNPADKMGTGLW